jgi:phage-related protein
MAIGFTLLDGTTQAIPDRSLKHSSKPRVLTAKFGDGYEQRLADGINNIEQTFTLAFNNRTDDDIDDIVAFFDDKKGVTSFDYTYPDTNAGGGETTVKVVCDSYDTTFVNDEFSSCSATLRRVYEA